ncbi:adenylyltransferase/cytidyltransferase family protein [Thermosynechococcaceae cyanobacterium BACA0444]|uniref:Adenylyltransferase/cytidyltransferase family protein n=1 Tax=Pseudocalidococcus azoricus BACA0444 TaxID=2918990 RepID=A0AAE4FQV3_9CYAN|nr:adenylyltransferase/cytidyltransferase family protein [Pseudocalidococcus azoricus]MDS3860064.1 adenylyltransferase/cytidyltransferase family protein [Pseudocalidococcus azoricus BACA0444]
MTTAITFGCFDLLHYGHLRLLARMAEMAAHIIVGLATDEVVMAGGKETPFYSFEIRREMLLHTRYVDQVLRHGGKIDGQGRVKIIQEKIEFIQACDVDLVIMGSDWLGEYDFLRPYCQVYYLERTPWISTTEIKRLSTLV